MFTPGDVILIDFPGIQGTKPRPGIVVSSANYHLVRPDVIVGLCTSNIASGRTSMDYLLQDWLAAGLTMPTAYRSFFTTTTVRRVHHLIGHLSDHDWAEVQSRLRRAIAVT